MRITELKLSSFRGIASEFELPFDNSGKNLLVYGENGSAKSSLARALELVFDPKSVSNLGDHQNLFVRTPPEIEISFSGTKGGAVHKETITWTSAAPKSLPSWLLSSAARSAFLDHRKLLLLSDRSRDLSESFFRTTVQILFAHLEAGRSGKSVSALWQQIEIDIAVYQKAQKSRSREAETGVTDAVASHTPIETAINQLNQALDDYLMPRGPRPAELVTEAERLLGYFEGLKLKVQLEFEHLTFNRADGTTSGGRINPHVTYCTKELGMQNDDDEWSANHHHILNEARLTALSLALFFAAVRLQDRTPYIAGANDPDNPARLLVLDDILVGLDYEHRIPVLNIILKEFAKDRRYQVMLLTHNRVWFDICRLQLDEKEWKVVEIFAKRGLGPDNSDFPIRKKAATDLIKRAKEFLADNEYPAAANYARTALETALKTICHRRHVPIPYRSDSEKYSANTFFTALRDVKRREGTTWHLIPLYLQKQLVAMRNTVLNALSHPHPTSITPTEIRNAISIAERLVRIAKSIKAPPVPDE